jgi:membrane-bound ClpP family serine protease
MTLIILLFSLGILFIAVEVIIPGAILGSIGGLLMFIGCVMAFVTFGNGGGLLAVLAAFAVGALAFFIEFRILPKTKFGKRAFLTREITAVAAAVGSEARELIGKSAEAVTPLVPSGYILVDGHRHEAFCQSGHAPAGSLLEITGADSFRLIVKITNS